MGMVESDSAGLGVWEELYVADWNRLVRVGWLILGDRESAEDAVQSVFLRLTTRSGEVENPSSFLTRCVINECYSIGRRRRLFAAKRHLFLRDDSEAPVHLVDFADILGSLPDRQRVAVVMRVLQRASDVEIGEALGCRTGTARSLVSRGLSTLRRRYDESE